MSLRRKSDKPFYLQLAPSSRLPPPSLSLPRLLFSHNTSPPKVRERTTRQSNQPSEAPTFSTDTPHLTHTQKKMQSIYLGGGRNRNLVSGASSLFSYNSPLSRKLYKYEKKNNKPSPTVGTKNKKTLHGRGPTLTLLDTNQLQSCPCGGVPLTLRRIPCLPPRVYESRGLATPTPSQLSPLPAHLLHANNF